MTIVGPLIQRLEFVIQIRQGIIDVVYKQISVRFCAESSFIRQASFGRDVEEPIFFAGAKSNR